MTLYYAVIAIIIVILIIYVLSRPLGIFHSYNKVMTMDIYYSAHLSTILLYYADDVRAFHLSL